VTLGADSRIGDGDWRLHLADGKILTNAQTMGEVVSTDPATETASFFKTIEVKCPSCRGPVMVAIPDARVVGGILEKRPGKSEEDLLRERIALKLKEKYTGQREVLEEFVRWATARQGGADKTKSIFYKSAAEVVEEFLNGPTIEEKPAPVLFHEGRLLVSRIDVSMVDESNPSDAVEGVKIGVVRTGETPALVLHQGITDSAGLCTMNMAYQPQSGDVLRFRKLRFKPIEVEVEQLLEELNTDENVQGIMVTGSESALRLEVHMHPDW